MERFLANYATAAHLALLAVAPLFLFPYCDESAIATVLLWLSLLSATWVLMSPSCRGGEMPHHARARQLNEIVRDPLTWFLLVVVVFAGVRALNGGVSIAYDAELMVWSLKPPHVEILPGVVNGCGYFPFATSVALFVLLLGARHALSYSSAIAFFAFASALSGLSAVAACIGLSYELEPLVKLSQCSYVEPSFVGVAYGVNLLGGIVALFGCIEAGWHRAEPFAVIGLVSNAIGMVLFSPVAAIAVFFVLFLALVVCSLFLMRGRFSGSGAFRCAIAVLLSVAAPVLLVMFVDSFGPIAEKKAAIMAIKPFPDGFVAARDALSSMALKAWKDSPWLGVGLGAFPLNAKFVASQVDWSVIAPGQQTPLNGWWTLLVERGITGALLIALGLAFLAWTYFSRLVKSFGRGWWRPACLVGPLVVMALTALAFVDCSYLRSDVLMPSAVAIALSACAFNTGSRDSGS